MLAAGIICSAGLYIGTSTNSNASTSTSGGYYVKFPCMIGTGNYCAMNGNGCGLASRCRHSIE